MVIEKKLITENTAKALRNRINNMRSLESNKEESDKQFISKYIAVSEQISNVRVRTSINGHYIETDEPESLGGSNKAPSPVDLLFAAIANCLEVSGLMYLGLSNLKIKSLKVQVEAYFDKRCALINGPMAGLYDISYKWFVETDENLKKIEKILAKVEKTCPVVGSLKRNHDDDISETIVIL